MGTGAQMFSVNEPSPHLSGVLPWAHVLHHLEWPSNIPIFQYGTPFQSYHARSGLLGWAQAQEQAESGRGLWKGPSTVPGRESTQWVWLPKTGFIVSQASLPQWHQRRHTGGASERIG